MLKRAFDILVSSTGLALASPILFLVMFLVWIEDRHSPFYIAPRVGRHGRQFRMVKMRSMVINADRNGISSTSSNDRRITPVGRFIRKYKIDELTQLWNVLLGDMSLVGPRPQVQSGVDLYTNRERDLLSVRPGITDFASIVFSDEGAVLKDSRDPDSDYDIYIRPWKSRLGLIYIARRSLLLDLKLIYATLVAIVSRRSALRIVKDLLNNVDAPIDIIRMAERMQPLKSATPPGNDFVI